MLVHDRNNVPQFLVMLKKLSSKRIEIGIMGDEAGGEIHENSDMTILAIAQVHEFGAPSVNIPERSFIRAAFDKYQEDIASKAENLLEDVILLRLPVDIFFDTLGEYLTGIVQEYLTNLSNPPLKVGTIDSKGSSNPLIDTGQLRDSITYRVVG